MHNFWFKMTKTTIPHSYNSQTFEQFNGGRTVSTCKWGHEKKLFFDLFFFYFSEPRQIAGQTFFFVFLNFSWFSRKTANKGQKMTFFCSDCKYVQKLIK